MDLLAACSMSILSNVLDFETYCYPNQSSDDNDNDNEKQARKMELFDYNSKSPDDRAGCVYVRGLALDLLKWFSVNYLLVEPDGKPTLDTYAVLMNNLCHQVYMVWLAKKKASDEDVKGAPHCTLGLLERQLRGLFPKDFTAFSILDKKLSEGSESDTMMFMDFTDWKVEKQPIRPYSHQPADIVALGMTPLDRKYAQGCLVNFDITKSEDSKSNHLCPSRFSNAVDQVMFNPRRLKGNETLY